MMAAASCRRFSLLSKLPLEIQTLIWHAALPDDDGPALLPYRKGCWQPRRLAILDEGYDAATGDNVHMDFRLDLLDKAHVTVTLTSVDREARRVALFWMRRNIKASEVRLREGHLSCVFARSFDSSRDTLFIEADKLNDFYCEPYDRLFEPDLADLMVSSGPTVTRLAVPEPVFRSEGGSLTEIFQWHSGVVVVLVVVGMQPRWECNSLQVQRRWEVKGVPDYRLSWDLAQQRFKVFVAGEEGGDIHACGWIENVCKEWIEGLVWHQVEALEIRPAYVIRQGPGAAGCEARPRLQIAGSCQS